MLTTTNVVFEMQPIQDVRRTADAVWLTFRDGSVARLDHDHPNFDVLMIYVESDWRRSRPVGVIMDPSGRVLDLGAAHDTPRPLRPGVSERPDPVPGRFLGLQPSLRADPRPAGVRAYPHHADESGRDWA